MHHSIELPPEPHSAGAARHFVEDSLHGQVRADVAEIAVLLTSELVTNVIVHARTPLRLDLDCADANVRVEVCDDIARVPTLRGNHEQRMTGRGLHLVDALAGKWGVEPDPPGKRVWFELSA